MPCKHACEGARQKPLGRRRRQAGDLEAEVPQDGLAMSSQLIQELGLQASVAEQTSLDYQGQQCVPVMIDRQKYRLAVGIPHAVVPSQSHAPSSKGAGQQLMAIQPA